MVEGAEITQEPGSVTIKEFTARAKIIGPIIEAIVTTIIGGYSATATESNLFIIAAIAVVEDFVRKFLFLLQLHLHLHQDRR